MYMLTAFLLVFPLAILLTFSIFYIQNKNFFKMKKIEVIKRKYSIKQEDLKCFEYFMKKYSLKHKKGKITGIYKNVRVNLSFEGEDEIDYIVIVLLPLKNSFCFKISDDIKNDFETGDKVFDSNVYISTSDKERTLSLLNSYTRNLISELNSNFLSFSILNNMFYISVSTFKFCYFEEKIEEIIKLIEDLTTNKATEDMLIENIKNDPVDNFRYICLKQLKDCFDNIYNAQLYINLLNDKIDEIVLLALDALENINKIEFVEHILPLTKGFTPAEVKQKALKTIDELQKNVSKDMKGTLSVADITSEEGNLLIVEDGGDGGKLSLK